MIVSVIDCMSYLYCFYHCFFYFYLFKKNIFLFIVLCVFLYFIITAALCVLISGWMHSKQQLTSVLANLH